MTISAVPLALAASLALAAPAAAQCDAVELAPPGAEPLDVVASDDGRYLVLVERDRRRLHPMRWDDGTGAWIAEGTIETSTSTETHGPGRWRVARSADVIALALDVFDGFSVWIYEREGSGWNSGTYLWDYAAGWPTLDQEAIHGIAVHADGDLIVLGNGDDHYNEGSIRLIHRVGGAWQALGWGSLSGSPFGARFGQSVDLDGERIAVGAPGPIPVRPTGRVALLDLPEAPGDYGATLRAVVDPTDPTVTGFGHHLAYEGRWLVVSAKTWTEGAVEVFERPTPTAPFQSIGWLDLPAPYAGQPVDSLDLHGGRLSVGAGAVFEFDLTADGPVLQAVRVDGSGAATARALPGTVATGPTTAPFVAVDPLVHVFCSCAPATAPCGNDAVLGGCVNSSGAAARLSGCGSTSAAADDLVLRAEGLPAGTWGTPFMGRAVDPTPLGNGARCVGGSIYRYAPSLAGGTTLEFGGLVAFSQAHHPVQASLAAGRTWSFQVWYRDVGGPCGATSSVTNAVTVTFQP